MLSEVGSMHNSHFVGIVRRMRRAILVSTAVLWTIFLAAGCGGGSQAEKGHHAHDEGHGESHSAKLAMSPESDSGVSGTAAFEDGSEGVRVELELRNLPKPDTLYLTHIHPGTCVQGEQEEPHSEHHEHGEEIEYPLSQAESNSEDDGSSTTTLEHTSVEKLFSGEPKHVNVHEAGSGDPPILACADLNEAL